MNSLSYEQSGLITGATARLKTSGYNVILLSSPHIDELIDSEPRVWVAMEFDKYVRFSAPAKDLELIK
jgi:hypothetical protein